MVKKERLFKPHSECEFLDSFDANLVKQLKIEGVLKRFKKEDILDLTKGGGISIVCAEGGQDSGAYHRECVRRSSSIRLFGGAMLISPRFKGYTRMEAKIVLDNISLGLLHDKTESIFPIFHWPCTIGIAFGHNMKESLTMVSEVMGILNNNPFFSTEKIYPLFHVKRINSRGNVEQNTYLLDVKKLRRNDQLGL